MREMKDSGIEWIGEIPKEWNIIPTKYCFTVNNGSDPTTNDGDTPVYGSGSKSFKTCIEFKEGPTVLLGRKGTVNIPQWIEGRYWNVDTAFDVKPKGNYSLKFFYYTAICFDYENYSTQTALPSMTQGNYLNIKLPYMPLPDQYRIANFLDAKCAEIDALSADIQMQIDTLEQYKRSIITEAVTKGLNPDVEMKDSGNQYWGSIPTNWHLSDIKYLFEIIKRIAGKEGYDILSVTQKGIKIKDISNNEGQVAESYANYQFVYPGDFVMNHMDLLTGWVDCSKLFGVTSPDYRVFRLRDKNNSLSYYKYIMQTCYMNRIFYSLGQGVSNLGRWRLQTSSFNNFMVPVPPVEVQESIATYLDKKCTEINACIDDKQRQLEVLEEYKKSLIYEYVTGKKEVPENA
mgnify:CR=1 FL=1